METTADDLIPVNPRELLILMALGRGSAHGYSILKQAEELGGGSVRFDPANVYRTLRKLEADGVVEETEGPLDGGERRRYYRMTDLGRRVLALETSRLERLALEARNRRLIGEA